MPSRTTRMPPAETAAFVCDLVLRTFLFTYIRPIYEKDWSCQMPRMQVLRTYVRSYNRAANGSALHGSNRGLFIVINMHCVWYVRHVRYGWSSTSNPCSGENCPCFVNPCGCTLQMNPWRVWLMMVRFLHFSFLCFFFRCLTACGDKRLHVSWIMIHRRIYLTG